MGDGWVSATAPPHTYKIAPDGAHRPASKVSFYLRFFGFNARAINTTRAMNAA